MSAAQSELFSQIIDKLSVYSTKTKTVLHASWIESPLGPLIAIADDKTLYLLEFFDTKGLEFELEKLKAPLIAATNTPLQSIEKELKAYFSGNLKKFNTPIAFLGTPFQKSAWHALTLIPYGETRSYAQQAQTLGKPTAYRAVANANGANQLAIIVPCHRIINSNGALGGYGGGISRKKWLLEHEKKMLNFSQRNTIS
jgi:AraC family transcriptional regulator of adaptative response/methylated-DNA-[protein]-cysteine methyltransferase